MSTLPTYRELDIVEEYFLLSRLAIVLLLQTRPRAEKEAGGTSLGSFIGWWRLSRDGAHLLGDDGRKGAERSRCRSTIGMPARGGFARLHGHTLTR